MSHRLELDRVGLSVAGHSLVRDLSLRVDAGEVVTVMGPSGSGKSSLLALICGTLSGSFKTAGDVRIDGGSVLALPPERRRVGILFQDDLLFPHLSVGANVAFGLSRGPARRRERRRLVAEALAAVGLAGYEDRDPASLSGGQRSRVATLRVLLSEPHVLLLDEPFAKLDSELREQVRAFVFERSRALPVLLVTHDPADAAAAGGRVLRLTADATLAPG